MPFWAVQRWQKQVPQAGETGSTDNAIIPLKERVVDEFYDPLLQLVRKIRGAA